MSECCGYQEDRLAVLYEETVKVRFEEEVSFHGLQGTELDMREARVTLTIQLQPFAGLTYQVGYSR